MLVILQSARAARDPTADGEGSEREQAMYLERAAVSVILREREKYKGYQTHPYNRDCYPHKRERCESPEEPPEESSAELLLGRVRALATTNPASLSLLVAL